MTAEKLFEEGSQFRVFEDAISDLEREVCFSKDSRFEHGCIKFEWSEMGGLYNLAISYQIKNGSTNQLNVEIDPSGGTLACVVLDGDPKICAEAQPMLDYVRSQVRSIPAQRAAALCEQIDGWFDKGRSLAQINTDLGKMAIEDESHGCLLIISMGEQQRATRYACLQHAERKGGISPPQ